MRRIFFIIFSAIALLMLGLDLWRGPIQGRPVEFATLADYWLAIDPSAFPAGEDAALVAADAASAGLPEQLLNAALTAPAFAIALGLALFFFLIRKRRPAVRKGLIFPRRRR